MTEAEWARGLALGRALQRARAGRSAAEVAQRAGISLDTLRKIERGAIAAPAFFTVAALARVLDLDLSALAETVGTGSANTETANTGSANTETANTETVSTRAVSTGPASDPRGLPIRSAA
jgi:transcriptional regulator with XRE-family HTH domain